MTVGEICALIEDWAPADWAYSWDNSGLALGSPTDVVRGVLVALTATREAFECAQAAGANLMLVHHPPIWKPLESLRTDRPNVRLLLDMARANVACYAAHTNLDVAPGGMSHILARHLGLNDIKPLMPVSHAMMLKLVTFVPEAHLATVREAICDAGAGVIGEYTHCSFSTPGMGTFMPSETANPFSGEKRVLNEEPERRLEVLVSKSRVGSVLDAMRRAHPYEEVAYDIVPLENYDASVGLGARGRLDSTMTLDTFAEHVRNTLGVTHVRVVGAPDVPVRRVAVVSGAGSDAIGTAANKVDVLVTGDVKYHEALSAQELGLALIDAGHDGTERCFVAAMADYLRKHAPNLAVDAYTEGETFRVLGG